MATKQISQLPSTNVSNDTDFFSFNNAQLIAIATELGLTETQIDDLFTQAISL